jgi:phospholipase/carboxylesterase
MAALASASSFRFTGVMLKTEFVPAKEPGSKRLLVALHGLGDSAAGYRWLPLELRLPSLNYLLVNAPDVYYGGFSWYDFSGDEGAGIRRSRKLLFDLLDAQPARGFPTENTVLFGFSQGCLMTVDVGFRYPRRFAALVGVSGYVHDLEILLRERSAVAGEQKMLFTHGTLDPLVPCAQVRKQVAVLQENGMCIDWVEFPKAHTIHGDAELDVIREFIKKHLSTEGRI